MSKPSPTDAERFIAPLPSQPNLEKHKSDAKALMAAYCRGEADARARIDALHPAAPKPGAFKLADALLVVARGYGFDSWPKLKRKIEMLTQTPVEQFVSAVKAGDVARVRELLEDNREVAATINAPLFEFKGTAAIAATRNLEMLDLLIAHGADINAKSDWEHGGFGILENATPQQAEELLRRGARIDVWAASHLGKLDELRALVAADPALVNAKGGDGKRPLHYACSVPIAELLLAHGAEIDALDDDHDSTPAQHLIGQHPEVARYLVSRGAQADLLLVCALGDVDLVRRQLDTDPAAIRERVSPDYFPMVHTAKNGGHIYQWTLGFYVSAFDVAREFGHADVIALLNERAGPRERLLDALWSEDTEAADAVIAEHSNLVAAFDAATLNQVADAARNNRAGVVRAMLDRGFPVTATSQHGATPLHWAAFHGNTAMLSILLAHGAPLELRDGDFDATPLAWATHDPLNRWTAISSSDQPGCVQALLDAGVKIEPRVFPTGHDGIDAVLRIRLFGL
jgi:ankyrin repeat protein